MREKTLSERLDETNELLRELGKHKEIEGEKKVRLPKLSNGKKKKNYVIVQEIKGNNIVNFRKLPIIDGNIKLPDQQTYHIADAEYIGNYKNTPILLLPDWSNEPITKEVMVRKIEENKSSIKPQKQIITLMENARLAEIAKPTGGKKSIIIFLVVGLGMYLVGAQLGWW